jgi:hypothetical protein
MDLEDAFPTFDIRPRHHDPSVESSRTEQRRIQNIGTVRRRDKNNAFIGFETVHFN